MLSPTKSRPKAAYRSRRVESFGLVVKEEVMEMFPDLVEDEKKNRRGRRIGKPAD